MELKIVLFVISILALHQNVETANILGIFTTLSKSHTLQGRALLQGLSERGHNVTMFTIFPTNKPTPNYREIAPEQNLIKIYYGHNDELNVFEAFKDFGPRTVFDFFSNSTRFTDYTIRDPVFQKLMHNPEVKYDLIIIVSFLNEAIFGLAHHYNVPFIVYSLSGPNMFNDPLVGNPANYAYVPAFSQGSQMNFLQRVGNTIANCGLDLLRYMVYYPAQDKLLEKHFPNAPNIYELMESTSLVFLNSHSSISSPRPLVPNMIEIGGFQEAKKKKPLPADLQTFMDNAKDGVIYVSLGSNVLSKHMPTHIRQAFIDALSKVKQQVLWKWEEDVLPGKPKNIKTSKWFPQSDLLLHPNIKLFITHGGWGSLTEAINAKVPLIGIPVGADQFKIVKEMEHSGYGVGIGLDNVTTTSLSWAINEVIYNPSYKAKIEELSGLFSDREIHPMDRAQYWVEYVIRTNGAKHLKSPALRLNRFQLILLDVVGFLLLVLGSISFGVYFVIKKLLTFCCGARKKEQNKEKTQ